MEPTKDFVCVVTWPPCSPLINAPDFTPVQLPSEHRLVAFTGTARQALAIDAELTVWEVAVPRNTPPTALRPRPVGPLGGRGVVGVACNDTVAFAWSGDGTVFAWGLDANEDGVMGLPGVFDCRVPTVVEGLKQYRVTQVAVGKTHSAAIDGSR